MLRVTIHETTTEQQIHIEGELAGSSLAELETAWKKSRAGRQGRRCVVNLNGTTFIDEYGEKVLLQMQREGAEFVATGVATRHQLEGLGIQGKAA